MGKKNTGDDLSIGTCHLWIGYIYLYGFQDYPNARNSLTSSKHYFKKAGDIRGEVFALANLVDVYIRRLRRRIDIDGKDSLIQTVRGAGYRLRAP